MSVTGIRWVAAVLALVVGNNIAVWVFVELALSCFHLGPRPAGLCSNWWYSNHEWVAAAALGVTAFLFAVLLPVLLAPRYKRSVGIIALAINVSLTAFTSDGWVSIWAIPIALTLAAVSVCLLYVRRKRTAHVA
jgi:hypothetical protein